MPSHTTLRPWMLVCGLLFGAPIQATPDTGTLDAVQQARERMETLDALRQQAAYVRQSAMRLERAQQDMGQSWRTLDQQARTAQQAVTQAGACLQTLQTRIDAQQSTLDTLAQHDALARAATRAVLLTSDADLPAQADRADTAVAQRQRTEQALGSVTSALLEQISTCRSASLTASRQLDDTRTAATRLRQEETALATQLTQLRTELAATWATGRTATAQHWLDALTTEPTLPPDQTLERWAASAGSSLAQPPEADTISSSFAPLAPAATQLRSAATDLIGLTDATDYIDQVATPAARSCQRDDCPSYTADRHQLAQRQATQQAVLDTGPAQARHTLQQLAALQREAQDTRQAHVQWLAQLQPLTDAVRRDAVQAASVSASAASTLEQTAEAAWQQARTDWKQAYRLAYGREPAETPRSHITRSVTVAPSAQAAPAPAPVATMPAPAIDSHAYQLLSAWNAETPGFGSYTYVLLSHPDELKKPAVRSRLTTLMSTLLREREHGSVAAAERPSVNLFCIPASRQGDGSDTADLVYHGELLFRLLGQAQRGLFLRSPAGRQIQSASGPFLLTLPTPIAQATSRSPLLFADLSHVPDSAIADLVQSYKNGLVEQFPQQQLTWQPPVGQRIALVMIGLARSSGQLLSHLIPAAQAGPASR